MWRRYLRIEVAEKGSGHKFILRFLPRPEWQLLKDYLRFIRVKEDQYIRFQSTPAVATATTSLTREPVPVSLGALGAGFMLLKRIYWSYSPLTI